MTSTYALRDTTTMLRRNLRHLQRYPGLSLFPILGPVVFLLLFVYVFGDTLGNGITTGGGRGAYVNFLTPGMLLFTVVGAANTTAISVAKDMTDGIIARFKTMRIWRPAVLTGHVLGSLILTLISLAVVIAVALPIGYHASVSPLRWLAALGLLVLLATALTWLTVALGLNAPTNNTDTEWVQRSSDTGQSRRTSAPQRCAHEPCLPPSAVGAWRQPDSPPWPHVRSRVSTCSAWSSIIALTTPPHVGSQSRRASSPRT